MQYNSLGYHSEYFLLDHDIIKRYNSFSEIVSESNYRTIDVTAILEFISLFYLLSDRTMVKNISRTPWLAKPSKDCKSWEYYNIKDRAIIINSELDFAGEFLVRLEKELLEYIGDKSHIGILLTGGMDSRVIAAVLKKILKRSAKGIEVTAFTWGMDGSRDVIYSKEIAKKYDWNFNQIELSANTLKDNIYTAAYRGCEFSPIHLHGMKAVSLEDKIDVVLAGSFGDSMGRAEYSGRHVSKLKSLETSLSNRFSLLYRSVFRGNIESARFDIARYKQLYPRGTRCSDYEVERLAHYMRRELNPCMSVINDAIPLYQCFAAPEIYELILNTPVIYRNDHLYYNILKAVDPDLLEIPWARTGRPYLISNIKKDNFAKDYHEYGYWIRNELAEFIESIILNGNIEKLRVFNIKALRSVIKLNRGYGGATINRFDEILVWLTSLSLMIEKFNLSSSESFWKRNMDEYVGGINSYLTALVYLHVSKWKL